MTNEERQQAIEWLKRRPVMMAGAKRMYDLAVEALEAYVPDMNVGETEPSCENDPKIAGCSDDTISRQAAIDAIHEDADWLAAQGSDWQAERMERDKSILKSLPAVQAEPLTDYEQRIFLAAMGKERSVCKKLTDEWDGMKLDVPCPVNLLQLCAEIERKVKAALWMN